MFILLLVCYSSITCIFYAAFSSPTNKIIIFFDDCVEIAFGLDLLLNFLYSYENPETLDTIIELKMIARNYVVKGTFIVDFVSVFPFEYIFLGYGELTKMARLARLNRLFRLIDTEHVKLLIDRLMSGS